MPFIEIDGLSKAFGKDKVIQDLSLGVNRGELMVVFGPSGSGKTVLLRLIAGVLIPDGGDIRINGQSMAGIQPDQRDVAMAFQNFALYPHMPAFENIASPLRARQLDEEEIKRRVHETASLLRIDHVLHHLPRQLSNGQKQRTALARSLVRGPAVLLLDDPLRNVDAKIRYEMRLELPRLLRRQQTTVLYVTQDYKEAMALGERVGVLFDGRFEQIDRPSGIYGQPASTRVARLFGDPPINLLPVRGASVGGRTTVRVGGVELPVPKHLAGRDCLMGLRPEDIQVSFEPVPDGVPVVLDAVTPLNVRTVMLLKTEDQTELLSSCPEDDLTHGPRGHAKVWARPHLDRALFFDPATGARI